MGVCPEQLAVLTAANAKRCVEPINQAPSRTKVRPPTVYLDGDDDATYCCL